MSSCSENENEKTKKCETKIKKSKLKKFSLIKDLEIFRDKEVDEIIDYIKNLHSFLEKKERKLKKYKEKIKLLEKQFKKLRKSKDSQETATKPSQSQSILTTTEKVEEDVKEEKLSFLDEIREAAESAQYENGFIYEPKSGLYYDQKTGYYYNAEYGLYYDGNTGCYYKLNQETNEFEFHSQVGNRKQKAKQNDDQVTNNDDNEINETIVIDVENQYVLSKRSKRKKAKVKSQRKSVKHDLDVCNEKNGDPEDGEILSSESNDEGNSEWDPYQDIAQKYPPSLRIIVQETNLDKIKVGELYIITFKGGSLGREGDHDVVIPDINVSKFHLKFTYHEEKGLYQCVDLGSRNGTFLNGKRISAAKQESETTDIVHGSTLQLSQTKLLCHTHPGNTTCGLCEPGLLVGIKDTQKVASLSHKEQLKKIQKRYGLENDKYIEHKTDKSSKYSDRASERRTKVGSSNPHEKTQVASTEIEISSDNKGFKMLSKLGWKHGEALGKEKDGVLEPIPVHSNEGKTGLGCKKITKVPNLSKLELKKIDTWRKTQERYNKLPKPSEVVSCGDSNSSSD